MKNIHDFDVFLIETSVSIQTRNLCIFATETLKDSKGIPWNLFAKGFNLNAPWKFKSTLSVWTQVRSVFNGIVTIALLGPKSWDLVLLKINPF